MKLIVIISVCLPKRESYGFLGLNKNNANQATVTKILLFIEDLKITFSPHKILIIHLIII